MAGRRELAAVKWRSIPKLHVKLLELHRFVLPLLPYHTKEVMMLGTDDTTIGDLLESMKPIGTQFVVVNHFDEAAYGPFDTFDEAFKWAMNTPNMNTTPIPLYPR